MDISDKLEKSDETKGKSELENLTSYIGIENSDQPVSPKKVYKYYF